MGPSSEWCLPSPDMVTTAVAMAMEDTGEAITGMADTVDTTARGPLMPSPAMATTAEDTAMLLRPRIRLWPWIRLLRQRVRIRTWLRTWLRLRTRLRLLRMKCS